ncbi:MAG: signal peptidase I [Pseudomonadota bacterium]
MRFALLPVCLITSALALLSGCDDPANWREQILPTNRYYVASTSMEPTFPKDATLSASWVDASDLSRGDVVMVKHSSGEYYILRIVGLPGDKVALSKGIVVLNDEEIEQKPAGFHVIEDSELGPISMARFSERLPGAKSAHFVLDEGPTMGDDFQAVTLGDGEYFLLGDNRDRSADSRFGPELRGLGIADGKQITRLVDLSSVAMP